MDELRVITLETKIRLLTERESEIERNISTWGKKANEVRLELMELEHEMRNIRKEIEQ